MDKIVARTSLVAVAIVIASEAIAEPEAVRHEQGQAFCGRTRVHRLQLVDCFNQPVIKLADFMRQENCLSGKNSLNRKTQKRRTTSHSQQNKDGLKTCFI